MKIYFSAAIAQKHELGHFYERIVTFLSHQKHHIFQDTTEVSLEEAINKSEEQRVEYYNQVLKWIGQSDALVLEVSFPSTLHIGHEISLALEKGKPVIALYQKGREPSFFLGKKDEKLVWAEYDEKSLESVLEDSLEFISDQLDVRFNLFISSKMNAYLNQIAKEEGIPKSVFLRGLIRKHMKEAGPQ